MGYRDDVETLRLRVTELEGELGDAHDLIARLRGEVTDAEPEIDWITGAPEHLLLERSLPGTLAPAALAAVAALADERIPAGRATVVGLTLVHRGLGGELRVAPDGAGGTSVRIRSEHRGATRRVFLGAVVFALFAYATVGVLTASAGLPAVVQVASTVIVAAIGVAAVRWLTARTVRDDHRRLTALFEAACDRVHTMGLRIDSAGFESARLRVRDEAWAQEVANDAAEEEAAEVPARRSASR